MVDRWILNKESKYAVSNGKYETFPRNFTRFYFEVGGIMYVDETQKYGIKKGHFYFVRFYPKRPGLINELLHVEADSNDIKNMPKGGYYELPHK